MGQGASKQPSGGEQIHSADHPVRLSQHLTETLQRSSETDSVRAKDLELKIQQRVRAELKSLEQAASKKLAELEDKISAEEPPSPATNAEKPDLGRESVQKEIDELRSRLEQRKLRNEVINDKGVEKAKSAVVECLRNNEHRSLNCYREVESFRKEVARLERGFLERHL